MDPSTTKITDPKPSRSENHANHPAATKAATADYAEYERQHGSWSSTHVRGRECGHELSSDDATEWHDKPTGEFCGSSEFSNGFTSYQRGILTTMFPILGTKQWLEQSADAITDRTNDGTNSIAKQTGAYSDHMTVYLF